MTSRHPLANPAARFVAATILLDSIGFGIVLPVLPRLVMEVGQIDLAEATRVGGWLAASYALMQFLCGPLIGNLGDRFGRRPVLLAAVAGFAIDHALTAFAPTLAWLFLGRLIAGAFGASYVPAMAAMADISAPEDRAKGFGLISAGFGIGFIVGPAIGGMLGDLGPRAPFVAAAILGGINLLYGLIAFPETLPRERRRAFNWRRANPLGALRVMRQIGDILPLGLVFLLWALANMVYPVTWAFYVTAAFGWSPGMIGLSLAWVGVIMVIVQLFVLGPVVKRAGERRTALIGFASAAAAYGMFTLIGQGWMVFPVLLLGALQGFVQPSLAALMSQQVGDDAQGELQGFTGSLSAVASIAAPLVLNPTLAWWTGPSAPFHFPGAAFAIATMMTLLCMIALGLIRAR